MTNEYYGSSSVGSNKDFFAHYGVKGIKWGVRNAIALGNQKRLDRHFAKAVKKLNKLQDKALHSGKYAAKAAGYGAAAAGAGALAIGGTGLVKKGMNVTGKAMETAGRKMLDSHKHGTLGTILTRTGHSVNKAGDAVGTWGNLKSKPVYKKIAKTVTDRVTGKTKTVFVYSQVGKRMSNDTKFRIGAGAAALGLGALAAKNAYTASNSRKYYDKASRFKTAMDDAFSGTKYSGQYVVPLKERKKRRKSK